MALLLRLVACLALLSYYCEPARAAKGPRTREVEVDITVTAAGSLGVELTSDLKVASSAGATSDAARLIRAGDRLLRVAGKEVSGMSLGQVAPKLGPRPLTLTFKRREKIPESERGQGGGAGGRGNALQGNALHGNHLHLFAGGHAVRNFEFIPARIGGGVHCELKRLAVMIPEHGCEETATFLARKKAEQIAVEAAAGRSRGNRGDASLSAAADWDPRDLAASLRGRIVLIERGGCGFTRKAMAAANAGAAGVVVVNAEDAAFRIDPVVNAGSERAPDDAAAFDLTMPIGMVGSAAGRALRRALEDSVTEGFPGQVWVELEDRRTRCHGQVPEGNPLERHPLLELSQRRLAAAQAGAHARAGPGGVGVGVGVGAAAGGGGGAVDDDDDDDDDGYHGQHHYEEPNPRYVHMAVLPSGALRPTRPFDRRDSWLPVPLAEPPPRGSASNNPAAATAAAAAAAAAAAPVNVHGLAPETHADLDSISSGLGGGVPGVIPRPHMGTLAVHSGFIKLLRPSSADAPGLGGPFDFVAAGYSGLFPTAPSRITWLRPFEACPRPSGSGGGGGGKKPLDQLESERRKAIAGAFVVIERPPEDAPGSCSVDAMARTVQLLYARALIVVQDSAEPLFQLEAAQQLPTSVFIAVCLVSRAAGERLRLASRHAREEAGDGGGAKGGRAQGRGAASAGSAVVALLRDDARQHLWAELWALWDPGRWPRDAQGREAVRMRLLKAYGPRSAMHSPDLEAAVQACYDRAEKAWGAAAGARPPRDEL
eukprot:g1839.t1